MYGKHSRMNKYSGTKRSAESTALRGTYQIEDARRSSKTATSFKCAKINMQTCNRNQINYRNIP